MQTYKSINISVAEKAISKFLNHLYYLNEECVGFSLFDDRINAESKTKMAEKLLMFVEENQIEDEEISKKLIIKQENLKKFIATDSSSILIELFSKNTVKLLKRFGVSTDFLQSDPSMWNNLDDYKKGKDIIKRLKIVNDCAERGIKLVEDYHDKITKDEEQRQYLFKVSCV